MVRHLEVLGVPSLQLNTSDVPSRVGLTMSFSDSGCRALLQLPGEDSLDCSSIRSVWYRKPEPYGVTAAVPATQREFASDECREAVHGIYNHLRHKPWVDDPGTAYRASNKPLQLEVASQLGFLIPYSCITNDPSVALDFYNDCGGAVVYKTLSQPRISHSLSEVSGGEYAVYTTPISSADSSLWDSVYLAPCLFQERVAKLFDIRVTVVGSEVFAAEIRSQEDDESVVDWRRGDVTKLEYRPHTLPAAVATGCVKLLRLLGLNFGAIDLLLTPDSRYVFLEVNPNGQYGWLEQLAGLPISEALARHLVAT